MSTLPVRVSLANGVARDVGDVLVVGVTASCSDVRVQLPTRAPVVVTLDEPLTLDVALVPRQLGALQCHIALHTSHGRFTLPLAATGVRSPFRVAPLVGGRVPLAWRSAPSSSAIDGASSVPSAAGSSSSSSSSSSNATATPNAPLQLVGGVWRPRLRLYNPFNETLLVREVRTSGVGLHLSLPQKSSASTSSTNDAQFDLNATLANVARDAWHIAPRSSRTIALLRLDVTERRRHDGFVVIVTSRDKLVVPVSATGELDGVHAAPDALRFGIVVAPGGRRRVEFFLFLLKFYTLSFLPCVF